MRNQRKENTGFGLACCARADRVMANVVSAIGYRCDVVMNDSVSELASTVMSLLMSYTMLGHVENVTRPDEIEQPNVQVLPPAMAWSIRERIVGRMR